VDMFMTPAGVTVTTPTNGATVGRPTHFIASAVANQPITYMRIYVDNQSCYGIASNKLDTWLTMAVGSRNVVVQAWDTAGNIYKESLTVNVAPPLPEKKPSGLDFYVSTAGSDSNDGSLAKPWVTIAHAASVVQPGATVHVAAGKYSGSIITSVSGTANARIRFVSDQRWGAQIIGTAAEATWQNRGDYIDIVGFDVSGATPNGIENLGSNARILGNRVHDIVASCDSNGGSGINNANYSAHDNDIVGNIVYRVRASASCSKPHGVGIYHSNVRGHVSNNIAFQNGTVGIQLWHAANNVTVANNTVFNNDLNGIVIGAGDSPGGVTNDYSAVVNNISFSNGYYGIQEFGSTGPHNRYLNNLMSGNPSGNLSLLTGTASGSIFTNPQFVNYTGDGDGDYHLSSNSPASDAGTAQSAPAADFDGAPRPYGKALDIGAFERGAPAGNWPWP
jgi:hypothetical protein